jgi:predicted dehydrogenase
LCYKETTTRRFFFILEVGILEPVKIGVIGVGGMGGNHCRALSELEETELVAVADVNEETAQRVGQEYGAKAFTDYKQLITDGGVEAVAIVTPHFFHPPIAEFAAAHGVHVLSEKPIAVTVSAAQKMVDACREGGVLLGVMFQQRLTNWRRKIHEIVSSGELGDIHRISLTAPWYRTQAYYDSGAWRGTWKGEGGGVLMNQAPHSVDQFLWIGGPPKSVQAITTTRLHNIEVENTALAICDYGDGRVGTFYATTAELPTGERMEVIGDKGALIWDDGKLRRLEPATPISTHLLTEPGSWSSPDSTWSEVEISEESGGHINGHQRFAQAVRANDPSLLVATGEDGLRALELANAILMAGYTRREIELPLDAAAFDAMLEKLQAGTKPDELHVR